MSKQSFPASLRILQSVSFLSGAEDSLPAINTSIVSDRAIVAVDQTNTLYMLRKDSVATADNLNIVAPAEGGPGRWFLYAAGPGYLQNVSVAHAAIPPASTIDSPFTVLGVSGTNDIVDYSLTDTGLPTGVVTGPVRVTGANAAVMRFGNLTAATVAAGTITFRMAVVEGG